MIDFLCEVLCTSVVFAKMIILGVLIIGFLILPMALIVFFNTPWAMLAAIPSWATAYTIWDRAV